MQLRCITLHAFRDIIREWSDVLPQPFPTGCIVGTATLVNIYSCNDPFAYSLTHLERRLGDFSRDRYAWQLNDRMAWPKPLPCRGYQGLWRLPPNLERAVDHILHEMS